MQAVLSARRARLCALVCWGACVAFCNLGRAEQVTLANGMTLDGGLGKIARLGADPLKAVGAGENLRILVVDNQLTRTFTFHDPGRLQLGASAPTPEERIEIDQRVQRVGRQIFSVGPILRVDPFDDYGHRIFSMSSTSGTADVVQGITIITPKWTQVEAIQGPGSYVWMMRIATSTIPRQQLSKILYRQIDPKNSEQRLSIVRLYMQSERFQDARLELEQVIKDFPGLTRLQDTVKSLHQLSAQRLLKEVELRLDAGQYRLGIQMLENFPSDGVAGEMLLKVRETLKEMSDLNSVGTNTLKQLDEHVAGLTNDKNRADVKPIMDEIKRDLNANTLVRLADYLRLANDEKALPEQKLAFAISGWLMGSGSATENFATTLSLVRVRELVQKYLVTSRQPEREAILAELASQEGATPENVSKIIAHMKPPLAASLPGAGVPDLGNPAEVLGTQAPNPKLPAAPPPPMPPAAAPPADKKGPAGKAAFDPLGGCGDPPANGGVLDVQPDKPLPAIPPPAADVAAPPPAPNQGWYAGVSGLLEWTTKGVPEDPQLKYYVQLPPQYDPYRRYPCIVTLNGAGTTPLQQIDWWAGGYDPKADNRFGQATRHGYIVIAPRWTREHQRKYECSSREHAAVLLALRDAIKRLAIDTDRVFLSGHSMGGDAAWDIGLSHPDLWAGVIPIVATTSKYIAHYSENAHYVPLYFVMGEKDGDKLEKNADDLNRYVGYLNYDAMIVQYQGRGHEHFLDEILNLFTWMNLHQRTFFVRDFEVDTLRPWDNFFWWVEGSRFLDSNIILPAEWGEKPPRKPVAARTEGHVLPTNGVNVRSAARKVTVWLSPEIVKFEQPMTITINNKRQTKVQPSTATILEDVRTRGDRQHPFWAKVETP
ncbi:MAG TPA: peptidase [Pirellulaceae bacterium]|nr:peptidase [Pirellulaceae bacterium]